MRNFFKNIKNTVKAKLNAVKAAVCRKIQRTRAAVNAAAIRLAVRSNTMLHFVFRRPLHCLLR